MAIRGNTSDLQAMAKACWAALLHKVDFPKPETRHRCCPAGNTSWCDWQRLKAENQQEEYVPTDSLPLAVYDVVKPIWVQLTDKSLLQGCLCGATQNRNEAWNGMLWGMCPKSKFASTEVVQICAALTCIRLNHGSSVYGDVLEELGIPGG